MRHATLRDARGSFMALRFCSISLFFIAFLSVSSWAEPVKTQKQMSDREKEQYAKMSALYAEKTFMSSCLQNYQLYISTEAGTYTAQSRPDLYKKLSDACGCYTRGVMKAASPEDVMDYVGAVYGYEDGTRQLTPERQAYFRTQNFARVARYTADESVRKKCGFNR